MISECGHSSQRNEVDNSTTACVERSTYNHLIVKALQGVRFAVLQGWTGSDTENRGAIGKGSSKARESIGEAILELDLIEPSFAMSAHPLFAVTKHTPTLPEILAYPSAACTAVVSCRVSIRRMPTSCAPTRKASKCPPCKPNATSVPRWRRA